MSIYFAQVGPHIKIGFSVSPERRVRNLMASATRYGRPDGTPTGRADRVLLKTIPGGLSTERAVHAALDDYAVGGEWFVDEPAVRAYIATVTANGPFEPLTREGGPAFDGYDETRDLSSEDQAALRVVLDGMLRRAA